MEYLLLAASLVAQIKAALRAPSGDPAAIVEIPQIRTYVGGNHVALDVKVTKLP